MAAKGRKRGHAVEHENEERWLLTYADMITLLMALFMVLFSISSVNISKYQTLQMSLKAAFSGSILSGGSAILQSGSESTRFHTPATAEVPSIMPLTPSIPKPIDSGSGAGQAEVQAAEQEAQSASAEQADFEALKFRLDAYAKAHGFSNQVTTQIDRQGLVVTVLTDKLLFASGQATLQPGGEPLLDEVANLLDVDKTHPIVIEGYTDNQPIDTPQFPSNWELSTDRATTVLQYLLSRGVSSSRLAAEGFADLHPVASNATPGGRALNRRVEIVFQRQYPETTA
jgi:chemotaxis protein MotB